jgi:hypothetical protein
MLVAAARGIKQVAQRVLGAIVAQRHRLDDAPSHTRTSCQGALTTSCGPSGIVMHPGLASRSARRPGRRRRSHSTNGCVVHLPRLLTQILAAQDARTSALNASHQTPARARCDPDKRRADLHDYASDAVPVICIQGPLSPTGCSTRPSISA